MGTRIALHVRDGGRLWILPPSRGGSVGQFFVWEDQFFVFVPEIAGNEPQYSVGCLVVFLCLFLPLEVFGDDNSLIPLLFCCRQMLIGHVMVAAHIVVSDVHHITFIYIETHLPLVCPFNKFIDIFM